MSTVIGAGADGVDGFGVVMGYTRFFEAEMDDPAPAARATRTNVHAGAKHLREALQGFQQRVAAGSLVVVVPSTRSKLARSNSSTAYVRD